MSAASTYAAAVAADRTASAAVEATRPEGCEVGRFTMNVSHDGGLNIAAEGLGDENLSVEDVAALIEWLNLTFV